MHKENAQPHLVITHYADLLNPSSLNVSTEIESTHLENKKIVLMIGELAEKSSISLADAQTLMYQLQLYYVTGGDEKFSLVEKFYRDPSGFQYQWLIDEIGNIKGIGK
ncbi:hypothetical protein HK096_006658, partial [Nowakowskiella sp. JEL0078]